MRCRCASCKRVSYCGAGCQRAHWRMGHKRQCGVLKAARERVGGWVCLRGWMDGTHIDSRFPTHTRRPP